MGRTWVLDTETKGTGAHMVPLEKVLEKPAPRNEPLVVPPKAKRREPKLAPPRAPREFRVVDVLSRAVLAEWASASEALSVLSDVRSIVDVTVFIWEPTARRWRLLSLEEQRTMWDRRRKSPPRRARVGPEDE
jgi:hypothetical protein